MKRRQSRLKFASHIEASAQTSHDIPCICDENKKNGRQQQQQRRRTSKRQRKKKTNKKKSVVCKSTREWTEKTKWEICLINNSIDELLILTAVTQNEQTAATDLELDSRRRKFECTKTWNLRRRNNSRLIFGFVFFSTFFCVFCCRSFRVRWWFRSGTLTLTHTRTKVRKNERKQKRKKNNTKKICEMAFGTNLVIEQSVGLLIEYYKSCFIPSAAAILSHFELLCIWYR